MAGYIGSRIAGIQVDGYTQSEANAEFVQVTGDTMTGNLTVQGAFTSRGIDDNATSTAMTLDSSGNLLVGTTDTNPSNDSDASAGLCYNVGFGGQLLVRATANSPLVLNRTTSDGDIALFRKNGSTVGSIGNTGSTLTINGSSSSIYVGGTGAAIWPTVDNARDLGTSGLRFDDIYATNAIIQTSDRNEKQDIEALSDAEQRVAVAAKGLLRKYRWKDAVAEKGDAARIHFGIIAQDLQAAFEAEGLDAGRYAMFISSTWWEAEVEKTREVEQEDGTTITETYTATETYDEPTEGATERTRLGVRYPELLAFIIAAL